MAFDKRIDVFLNFSAEDIGKNFGAHLHRSLRRADIQTITGDVSRSDTLSSVQQSRISVVVFSKNYASSAQALDELVNIRECSGTGGLVVLPVFYNFDRYSLMNQLETSKGEHELQQTGSMSRWRQALEEISSMPGYDLYKFADRNEAACVRKFVETILSELHIINSAMDRTLFLLLCPQLSIGMTSSLVFGVQIHVEVLQVIYTRLFLGLEYVHS
ncbi:toll/interleukin-1 receptor-like protein isoform X1 [Apium graveolens]|uniref:toll/interleukin-1 receptor-like protein isoform X1 n=1 Tax=Apium graveolens TaxID=4045 RepID=UPI003D78CBA1